MIDDDMPQTLETKIAPSVSASSSHKPDGSFAPGNKYAIKSGEPRNKDGTNHWVKAQRRFQEFAMSVGADGKTYDYSILQAIRLNAMKPGGTGASDRRLWMEYTRGAARKTTSQLELAEHLRQVAADQMRVLFQALGEQIHSMAAEKIAEVLGTVMAKADTRIERFLEAAHVFSADDLELPPQPPAIEAVEKREDGAQVAEPGPSATASATGER